VCHRGNLDAGVMDAEGNKLFGDEDLNGDTVEGDAHGNGRDRDDDESAAPEDDRAALGLSEARW
jgi:hypothetical protein